MYSSKSIQMRFGYLAGTLFLIGCSIPLAPSTPIAILPLPLQPASPLFPPTTVQPARQPSLFTFIRTIEVAPNAQFRSGAFARVNYIPATDLLVTTFSGQLSQPTGECQGGGHGYVEYNLDLEPTGKDGVLNCEVADMAGVMVNNTYYDVSMHAEQGGIGWRIMKFDAVNWNRQADIFFPLQTPKEKDADPMAAYVGGRLDVSSFFSETGEFSPPEQGAGTHHQFFSDDLVFLDKRILVDTPHTNGSSMIFVDGVYYFISATAFAGDCIVMKYDQEWNYLGMKKLIDQAHFPTGVAFDGSRFYVAYTDTSQRTEPGFFPVYLNVHLAVFDREWNLLEDLAVTNAPASEKRRYTRAWVVVHGNRVYVSYDLEGSTGEAVAGFVPGRAFVNMYELVQTAP